MKGKRVAALIVAGTAGVAIAIAVTVRIHSWKSRLMTIQGAVIRSDSDTRKELPIADAVVTVTHGVNSVSTQSDSSGYFKVALPDDVWPGQTVELTFKNPGYQTVDNEMKINFRSTTRKLLVIAMVPIAQPITLEPGRSASVVSNIRIRYTVNSTSEENIGSALKTFQVVNRGNVPCNHQAPCSPNGYWKAATGSVTLDAGAGNELENVRASCISGPCPFTYIDLNGFVNGARTATASATDWSETTTFLVEGEVFHTMMTSNVRESYPVVFGRELDFTLPPTQEGVSIEAELNGSQMVFPLGPDLYLSWATCTASLSKQAKKSTVYRCELKSGYRF